MINENASMGSGSIAHLLLRFAVPATAGLIANALYNIVDRIFLGHVVGPSGLAGVTVAFPFINFLSAYSMLVGIGASSLMAFSLGEKDKSLFNSNDLDLINLTARGLRLGYLCLPFVGVIIVASYTLPAMGKVLENHIVNFGRQILFFFPFLFILPSYLGLDGIWLTLTSSGFGGFCLAGAILFREIGKIKMRMC